MALMSLILTDDVTDAYPNYMEAKVYIYKN